MKVGNIMFKKKKIPVVLITGYLGAGKTTLLNELLRQEQRKFALIVNDMGSINIDAKLLKQRNVNQMDTSVIELTNGCICCTLQDEFMTQIEEISKQKDIEAVFVEASGVSDPSSIAEGFLAYEEIKKKTRIYLSSIVTVVDADRIYKEFLAELEEQLSNEETDTDDADIINLVLDQIEFCNIIVLNKCDLLTPQQVEEVRKVIRKLQPKAEMMESIQGKVNSERIISEQHLNYEEVMNSSAIQKALKSEKEGESFEDEFGISSFVYEEKRPFDYDKLMNFIQNDYPETLIRAKGYVWFADDDIHVQLFEQAGRNVSVTELSNWVAAFPEKDRQEVFDNYPEVLEDWDEQYGDRCNQVVFIGKGYDKDEICRHLTACLT